MAYDMMPTQDAAPCGGCGGIHVNLGGVSPGLRVKGKRESAVVSQTERVCRGEFVQKVLEYVPQGDGLRWGTGDVTVLDAAELSEGRVGVVFAQNGQTKFKILALEDGALALGNALVLAEEEAAEEAVIVELERDRVLVVYNKDAAGMAAEIALTGRASSLTYTDIWDDGDPANLCACRIEQSNLLVSGLRRGGNNAGETWLHLLRPGGGQVYEDTALRMDGGDGDVYAGAWFLCQLSEGVAVQYYHQAVDKPVAFRILDVERVNNWGSYGRITVRCTGEGKYAESLPTLQATSLGNGRWAVAYGVGNLTADKTVVKSALALEVWDLDRYGANLVWYALEDSKFAAGIGGVSAAPFGLGAAVTYTGEDVARVIHCGVLDVPVVGPGVALGSNGGFCRVVPISATKALAVTQRDGDGWVRLLEVQERVVPNGVCVHGVALSGGDPGETINIRAPD